MFKNNIILFYMTTDWNQIDPRFFEILTPDFRSNNSNIFRVKYKKNEYIKIQTPKVILPKTIKTYSHNDNKYYKLSLCFYDYDFNHNTKRFINMLLDIDDYIRSSTKLLWRSLNKNMRNKIFIPSVRFNNTKTIAYMDVNIQTYMNDPVLSVYDHNKSEQDISYIMSGSYSLNIISILNIWQNSNKIGINWSVLQTKVFLPIIKLKECIIVDDTPHYNIATEYTTNKCDKYDKYIAMKKYGMPKEALEFKLKSDNIDIDEFYKYIKTTSTPPQRTPIKSIFSPSSIINPADLKNISLKSTTINNSTKKSKQSIGGFRPSQDQLHKIIHSLKKVNCIKLTE